MLTAEKKLEVAQRKTAKKLATLQVGAECKANAVNKAIEKEAAAMKKAAEKAEK